MSKKIVHLLDDDSSEAIRIGLVKCIQDIPEYLFFYTINRCNHFQFFRKDDLIRKGKYFNYFYSVFEAYNEKEQITYRFFSNKPIKTEKTKEITELFGYNEEEGYLSPSAKINFVTSCSYTSPDFSLILQPENNIFQIESYELGSDEELFDLIKYYE